MKDDDMTKETNVKHLREEINRSPARRARVDAEKRAIYEHLALNELRRALSMTQEQVAQLLGITQESVSQIERRDEILLSTLNKYVQALGGKLEVTAVVGEQRVPLMPAFDRRTGPLALDG
jgi:DNA-binding XRE family transcriptional regulator